MSKEFRRWKIDEAQLLRPSLQDYVPKNHLSRLIVALVSVAFTSRFQSRNSHALFRFGRYEGHDFSLTISLTAHFAEPIAHPKTGVRRVTLR
ncbi:hypothetical protein ACWTU6_10310 [Mesorhizobium sp. BHbsci]